MIKKILIKIYRAPINFLLFLLTTEIRRSIAADRVRIWNDLLKNCSIRTVQDGNKTATLITFGAPKLESIILADLGSDFKPNPENPELPAPKAPFVTASGIWVYD